MGGDERLVDERSRLQKKYPYSYEAFNKLENIFTSEIRYKLIKEAFKAKEKDVKLLELVFNY